MRDRGQPPPRGEGVPPILLTRKLVKGRGRRVFSAEGTAWANAWQQEGAWKVWSRARVSGWLQSVCIQVCAHVCMHVHVCLHMYLCVRVWCACADVHSGNRCQVQTSRPGQQTLLYLPSISVSISAPTKSSRVNPCS